MRDSWFSLVLIALVLAGSYVDRHRLQKAHAETNATYKRHIEKLKAEVIRRRQLSLRIADLADANTRKLSEELRPYGLRIRATNDGDSGLV